MKVLIADDNVDFCSTISEIVSGFGYETVMFNDPDSAIEYLNDNNREIGLALLDIEFGPSEKKTVTFSNPMGETVSEEVETFTWEKLDYVANIKDVFNL